MTGLEPATFCLGSVLDGLRTIASLSENRQSLRLAPALPCRSKHSEEPFGKPHVGKSVGKAGARDILNSQCRFRL